MSRTEIDLALLKVEDAHLPAIQHSSSTEASRE
jgi:hypothetical protein